MEVAPRRARNGEAKAWLDSQLEGQGELCSLWPFLASRGRPALKIEDRFVYAQSYICEVEYGPRPTSAHHPIASCGSMSCCTPKHLIWGIGSARETSGPEGLSEPIYAFDPVTKAPVGTIRLTGTHLARMEVGEVRRAYGEGATISELAVEFETTRSEIIRVVGR